MNTYVSKFEAQRASAALARLYPLAREGVAIAAAEVQGGIGLEGWCAVLIWPDHHFGVPYGVSQGLEELCAFIVGDLPIAVDRVLR